MEIVPQVARVSSHRISALAEALGQRRVAVLTGAGLSTESGIPDYRGEGTRRRARSPVQYRAYIEDAEARRRYWARAMLGWGRFSSTEPNEAHQALASLQTSGWGWAPITQNVDRLHQRAGSTDVIELHGALEDVRCLGCETLYPRAQVQTWLGEMNPSFAAHRAELAPDGDAELEDVEGFVVPSCPRCGGILKPHVVFFGEGVPRTRVETAYARVEAAEALVIAGTSLAVFSGYRFARRARDLGRPIYVLNVGPTRADDLATMLVRARLGDVLPRLATALVGPQAQPAATAGSGSN